MGEHGYLKRTMRKVNEKIGEGIDKADNVIDEAVEVGSETVKQAKKTGDELGKVAGKEITTIYKKGSKATTDRIRDAKMMTAGHSEIEVLERLATLWKDGALTDEEYSGLKRRILERL